MSIDLNVRARSSKPHDRLAILQRAYELGWDCLVWTTMVNGRLGSEKPLSNVDLDVRQAREALQQRALVVSEAQSEALGAGSRIPTQALVRQLSRITIVVEDPLDIHALGSGNDALRSFDIIAVRPMSARAFVAACQGADVDVISLDISRRLPFSLNRKHIDEAVRRGIHFEVCYSALLESSASRREALNGGNALVSCLRGRNIVLSSGVEVLSGLRGPEDVISLGCVLGLNTSSCRDSFSTNATILLQHATKRRQRYIPLEITSKTDYDIWNQSNKDKKNLAVKTVINKRQRQDMERGDSGGADSKSSSSDNESDNEVDENTCRAQKEAQGGSKKHASFDFLGFD